MCSNKDQQIIRFLEICRLHKGGIAHVTGKDEIDEKINNISDYPHLFVLACLMDRQMKAERAWEIPYLVCKYLCNGDFSFNTLSNLSQEDILGFFEKNTLHRFNASMSEIFYKAIKKIKDDYDSDASLIWTGGNSSAEIIYRFLCFDGCGVKIASMAANLLHRIFGIRYTDYSALDISPDIHIRRVLYRIGLIEKMDDTNLVIYRAKSICPEYPGILDECCWDMGRLCCHQTNPNCVLCEFKEICQTNIDSMVNI